MTEKKNLIKIRVLLTFFIVAALLLGIADFLIPDSFSRYSWDDSHTTGKILKISDEEEAVAVNASLSYVNKEFIQSSAQVKLFGIVPIKNVDMNVYGNIMLYPGGMPFGVKFFTNGLIVVGMADVDCDETSVPKMSKTPAYDAGIRIKDIILSVNGKDINSADEFIAAIEGSGGNPVDIKYKRGEEEFNTKITPSISSSDGKYKTGMWVRDSTAGIGTVTFINPKNNAFGGLGHGICDVDTGELMPLMRGVVVDVSISGITKGISGSPGELKGYFSSGKTGSLIGNRNSGVYGLLIQPPSNIPEGGPLPIALSNDIKEGKAYIWCTIDTGNPQKYSVEINNIKRGSADNKCFVVTVTDPVLLEKTGGIVQGMSGSPIIQDGRIIGAVTHVLINDPTRGYGIFIENMLAGMPEILN